MSEVREELQGMMMEAKAEINRQVDEAECIGDIRELKQQVGSGAGEPHGHFDEAGVLEVKSAPTLEI